MPLSWITVLKSVPWDEVIRNAPRVASGAKKLWNMVAGKETRSELSNADLPSVSGAGKQTMSEMEARMAALESSVSELRDQMLASSELIKELADQNTQLIRRIEIIRLRMIWAAVAGLPALLIALIILFFAFRA